MTRDQEGAWRLMMRNQTPSHTAPPKWWTAVRRRRDVAVGDRFVRATAYESRREVYVVTELRSQPNHPPHARLMGGTRGDTLLIAVSALLDPAFWRRLLDAGD